MPQPFQKWTVLPHGKLTLVDDNILSVVGQLHMPMTELPRRMTVVRLRDGRLVVFSAISLDEDEMAALESYGRPAFLVVPNSNHRLDAKVWKDRYPEMQVVAPAGSRDKIAEAVPVDTVAPQFDDPDVQFLTVPGTKDSEAALLIRTPNGTTLVFNDLVGNILHPKGFGGWFLKLSGFAGDEAQIPRVIKMTMVEDKAALRTQLQRWSEIESLRHILVSHGSAIEDDPRQTLRELAESLA